MTGEPVAGCTHRAGHVHGTYPAYSVCKCRCIACNKSNAAKSARRRKLAAMRKLEPAHVDPTAARRLLDDLRLRGWSLGELGRQMGSQGRDGRAYFRTVYDPWGKITREKQRKIEQLHARLVLQSPPARNRAERISVGMTRTLARERGCLPALAYDDLADPYSDTSGVRPESYHRSGADLLQEVDHLRGYGLSDETAAARLGVTVGAIVKARMRSAA